MKTPPLQLSFGIKTLRLECWELYYGKLRIKLRNYSDVFPTVQGISVSYTMGKNDTRYALIRWVTSDFTEHRRIVDSIHAEFKSIMMKRLDDKYGFAATTEEMDAFDKQLSAWEAQHC